jgi:tetratricopeptide (TPR) repeat protein
LQWETDAAKRDLAQDAACARVLNADVVAALGEGSFEWLSGCAFVLRDGARWRYHLVVREQMLRYLGQRSPKRYGEVHGRLAAYYDGLRNGLGLEAGKESKDKAWREYSLEWIYHELCAAPQVKLGLTLNGFLRALKYSSGFALKWAKVLVQAGTETECAVIREWGEQLRNGTEAGRNDRYADTIPSLTALLGAAQVEHKLTAVAFDRRGYCYCELGHLEMALQDAMKAAKIDTGEAKYQFGLGLIYDTQNDHNNAIIAYQEAIKLNPQYENAYKRLGAIYDTQNNYEQAIIAYRKAIEINLNYVNAFTNIKAVETQKTEQALELLRSHPAMKTSDLGEFQYCKNLSDPKV